MEKEKENKVKQTNKAPKKTKKGFFGKTLKMLLMLPFIVLVIIFIYTRLGTKSTMGLNSVISNPNSESVAALEQKIKALEVWRINIHDEMSEIKQIYEESREIGSDLTSLTAKVNEAYRNIEQIEQRTNTKNNSNQALLAINVSHLIHTMVKNSPFNSHVNILIASIENQGEQYKTLTGHLKELQEISKTGAPNLPSLLISFESVAKSVVAQEYYGKKDPVSKFKNIMSKWILVRKVEYVQQDPGNIDYILKSVEEYLQSNNLEQAIVWFEKIDIEKNEFAKKWLKDAKNRLFIESKIQDIYTSTISIISEK